MIAAHTPLPGSALKSVALKTEIIIPALLYQKPHPRSKPKNHTLYLEHAHATVDGDKKLDEGEMHDSVAAHSKTQ